ncbi:UPF0686 protein C11orf1 homolog [Gigantopelta aegis]|uniref:UPF0686 protein C11orf1 homolog n=1 Tax=Gigantopelta aegis TaxID=1735272 RepID=UPI001B888BA8|nr:UPF0686 protein C11orf1 homolog [Gigantopelta aegis]
MEARRLSPPFMSMVRSSGHGQTWTHHTDAEKFNEFGWRSTTNESNFENKTLVGNWNEERFDIEERKQGVQLPSQYNHYFETTYSTSIKGMPRKVPPELKHLIGREPYAYPGHQPELDSPSMKETYNSWATTSRVAYGDPCLRTRPLEILSSTNNQEAGGLSGST